MAQIERGEARIQRRISIKKALDAKVITAGFFNFFYSDCFLLTLWLQVDVISYIPSEREQLGMGFLFLCISNPHEYVINP